MDKNRIVTCKCGSGGIGCFTVIGIVLVTLKLLSVQPVAEWSWLWVLFPFWFPAALCFLVVFLVTTVVIIVNACSDR